MPNIVARGSENGTQFSFGDHDFNLRSQAAISFPVAFAASAAAAAASASALETAAVFPVAFAANAAAAAVSAAAALLASRGTPH